MIREYAIEKIKEAKSSKPENSDWSGFKVNTIEHAVMFILRSLNLRFKRELKIANDIFSSYNMRVDFTKQAEEAEAYWGINKENSEDLNYISLKTCRNLTSKISEMGTEPLLNSIPESAF